MLNDKAEKRLEKSFRKFVKRDRKIENAYLLIHSKNLGVHFKWAEGDTGAHPDQPYFIANNQKLFTAVIVAILEQQGKLSYEDKMMDYLDNEIIQDLHVLDRFSFTDQIEIRHLLNHSSGLFDFVEEKPKNGEPMIQMLLEEQSERLQKEEIIQQAKANLTSHFPPEKGFHYSDTGYLLLRLIIEKVTSRSYFELLQDFILKPLQMDNTYVIHHTEPVKQSEYPLAKSYIHGADMTSNKHIGFDDVIGRMISTSEDLLKLMDGLVHYKLLERENLNKMADWVKYPIGVDYGYGIIRIKDTFGLMPKKYNAWGSTSLTGSFLFYHQELETYFIGSLNCFRYHKNVIVLLKELVDIMYKYKK